VSAPYVAAFVAKLEQRDALSPQERTILASAATGGRRVAVGQDIVREGDRPKESTLMLSGYSARYNVLADGRRQISALHVKGDFVDLHSFLVHRMDHGVVALSDCTVCVVSHDALMSITERHPHLTRLLWLSTLVDAAIHRRWLVAMGRLSAPAQFAHLLCELWHRLAVVGEADRYGFDLPLTQAQLADVLGLSLVHVNRVTQELRQQGLIAWRNRRLTILDWPRLSAAAAFDPGYLNLAEGAR
jgi:CRP-like cAMP-binding protein